MKRRNPREPLPELAFPEPERPKRTARKPRTPEPLPRCARGHLLPKGSRPGSSVCPACYAQDRAAAAELERATFASPPPRIDLRDYSGRIIASLIDTGQRPRRTGRRRKPIRV